jgi:hypothetical protein
MHAPNAATPGFQLIRPHDWIANPAPDPCPAQTQSRLGHDGMRAAAKSPRISEQDGGEPGQNHNTKGPLAAAGQNPLSPFRFPGQGVLLTCGVTPDTRPSSSLIKESSADRSTGKNAPEIVAVERVKQGCSRLVHWAGRALFSSCAAGHPAPRHQSKLCSTVQWIDHIHALYTGTLSAKRGKLISPRRHGLGMNVWKARHDSRPVSSRLPVEENAPRLRAAEMARCPGLFRL